MSLLRPSTVFRAPARLRPALATTAPRACLQKRFAQGYGDGKGNPVSEHPEKQGKLPSEELEHPGPPPPKVAQGRSQSSPDENPGSESQSQSQSQSSSSSSTQTKPASSTSKSGKSEAAEKWKSEHGGKEPGPKILNENPPGEKDASVRKHNEEMDTRAEKAHEQVKNEDAQSDKVSKDFWAGHGGRDREP
ncbi:uncharacterized protein EI97DRAFT_437505 [Westerdykella ornata]|uniref:Uncharacterized protein n=1 Tax=Westerdykella ornata TaxID=318751 RepID=A0A6A6J5G2_WESOR|nr:uncharacterized protein EI97DRAFT_437505 [Westerdykella ornata]KAF2271821.1 hypothetical protein EI97DRAFT_437505 [Westerdykella ornata]